MNQFIPTNYKYIKLRKKLKFHKTKEKKHIILRKGSLGLKLLESTQLTTNILESIRRSIIRRIKKVGKIEFFVHPNISITKKSVGVRMGKGAGNLDKWIVPVKKGKIIIELINVPHKIGILALKAASFKLPVKAKILIKK